MPFDDTSIRFVETVAAPEQPVRNTLASIGLTPVPRAIAEAHKAKTIAEFSSGNHWQKIMVEDGVARWIERGINNAVQLGHRPSYSSEQYETPAAVVQMYKDVKQNIRDAQFSIEYFYTDPVLNVRYVDAHGNSHKDCLAVWDNGKIVAIAEGTLRPRWRFGLLELVLSMIVVISMASMVI